MRKLFLAAVMGASVLAGVPAIAQTAAPPPAPGGPAGPRGAGPADADRDGIVTRAEATAEAERRFAAIDTNRDGKVTKDELRAERERHRAMRAERRGDAPPPPGAEMAKHRGKHDGMGKRLDPDRDGTATRAEWLKRAEDRFAREDANKDGRIDANERIAMRELRKMHRAGDTPPPPPPPAG
jgi:EF hand